MSFTMEDNLESGWVAVRPNVFEEKEKHKFVFIVAWNEVEGKFAITCHNRTVQRRSIGRDPLMETVIGVTQDEDRTKWPKSPVKAARSPAKGFKEGAARGLGPKMNSPSKTVINSSPVKTTAIHQFAMSPISPDIEILEPLKEDLFSPSPDSDTPDLDEFDGLFREDCSWAGLFSFQDLRTIHLQLCSVNSVLEPCLPTFPEEPAGMWTILFGSAEVPETEMDELCRGLQVYLGHALDTCGWKILSQIVFTENDDPEEYYESLSELKQTGYEEALQRVQQHLQQLLERHRAMDSMVELLQVFEEEDQAYGELLEASTQLYQYLLQPFRDMRELAMLRRQQIKISVENDFLGPRRIDALKREDLDWQMKAQEAVLNIQEFTVKYFDTTSRAQKAVYERMKVDQRKFGKAAWTAAVERMERLRYSVAKETLQLQRAREICLEQRKHTLREEMQGLCGGECAMARLDHMEALYYELQLQLYDIQAEILQCEELLLNAQLDSVRRQMTERQDEVVYYDTYESPDSMGEVDVAQREEMRRLQLNARQLESRRGRIATKRTYLRSKKEVCVCNHTKKLQKQPGAPKDSTSRHALQQQEEEEEEEKRVTRVSQERQKTLDRLRSFKKRHPGQVILKSLRLRAAHSRRRERGGPAREEAVTPEQPQCLSAGVQTDPCPPGALTSSTRSPPVGPQPPPPPPPLPPPQEEPAGQGERGEAGERAPPQARLSPLGPFIPRFFDSSQLVSARQKLRKTSELECQSRRESCPMDEVLASLKRGSFHLRKVEQRSLPPPSAAADPDNILVQIRRGVQLKHVPQREGRDSRALAAAAADPLTWSIHEALRRIKEASPDSDSEEEGSAGPDWES